MILPLVIFLLPEAYVLAHIALLSPTGFCAADMFSAGGFIAEGLVFGILTMCLLRVGRIWSRAAATALAAAFTCVIAVQIVSFHYTFDFFPHIALQNLENTRLFLTRFTFVVLAAAGLYAFGVIRWAWSFTPSRLPRFRVLAVVVILPFSFAFAAPSIEGHATGDARNVPDDPPIAAMSKTLLRLPGYADNDDFVPSLLELDGLLPDLGDGEYPLLKERVYSADAGVAPADGFQPNVLIIFTEGLSARLINAYDDTFPGLTPEISAFVRDRHSLSVRDYYSHTAATFRGLLGQLCSTYPASIAHPAWYGRFDARFRCLTDLFREAGYRTEFFDPHFRDEDHLHAMLRKIGFDEVLTAEDLLERHLGGKEPGDDVVRLAVQFVGSTVALTTEDTFAAVADAVERWRPEDGPQMLAFYPFGTHAWIDTPDGGVKYGNGDNNALNTTKELDERFGEFWRRFRESDAYGRTVVIFTTDHAKYHETSYVQALAGRGVSDYRRLFSDRVPFVIHDPRGVFTDELDADSATSIDFAPTVAHYLGLPNGPNPFLGTSLFESGRVSGVGLVNIDRTFYLTANGSVFDISAREEERFEELRQRVFRIHEIMENDRLWPAGAAGE